MEAGEVSGPQPGHADCRAPRCTGCRSESNAEHSLTAPPPANGERAITGEQWTSARSSVCVTWPAPLGPAHGRKREQVPGVPKDPPAHEAACPTQTHNSPRSAAGRLFLIISLLNETEPFGEGNSSLSTVKRSVNLQVRSGPDCRGSKRTLTEFTGATSPGGTGREPRPPGAGTLCHHVPAPTFLLRKAVGPQRERGNGRKENTQTSREQEREGGGAPRSEEGREARF